MTGLLPRKFDWDRLHHSTGGLVIDQDSRFADELCKPEELQTLILKSSEEETLLPLTAVVGNYARAKPYSAKTNMND